MTSSNLQALNRVRDRLIARRTSVLNQLRAFLLERGLVFAKSPARLRERMPEILENADEDLSSYAQAAGSALERVEGS